MNWAAYNILDPNPRLELLKWILSEIQIIFIIIQIYYTKIEQNTLLDGFDRFLKDIASFINNGSMMIVTNDDNNSNDNNININNLNSSHADFTAWIFFIMANIFVYSIMILGALLYSKDTVFSSYLSNIYRYLGRCRSWYCTVLFFIIHQLAVLQLQNILNNNTNVTFSNIEILVMVLSIMLCVSNFIVSLIFCLCFVIALDDHNYYHNHIQLLFGIIFKFGVVFISFIGYQLLQQLIFVGWIACFIGCRIWKHLQKSCYTPSFYQIISCLFLGIEVCQCIDIITHLIIHDINLYFFIILGICSPIISLFFYNLYTFRYNKVIFIPNPKLEADIISKYLSLKTYIDKGYFSDYFHREIYEYELIVEGEMINHQYTCMDCPQKDELKTYINDHTIRRLYFTNLRSHFLEKILLEGIEKYPRSFNLMKELVMLYHDNKKDIIKGMLYLQKFSTLCNTFSKLTILENLRIKIKNLHDSTKIIESGLKLEKLIKCEDFYDEFMQILKKHAQNTNTFWKIFQENSMHITALLEQSEIIHKEFSLIEKLWKKYESDIMKYYFKPLFVYSRFLILLKNQEVLGEEYLEMYYKLKLEAKEDHSEEKLTNNNLCSEKNAIINVSACKENLGEIVSCTPNINDILGYDSSKLLKNNMSVLLPDIYQSAHNILMEEYLKTSKGDVLNHNVIRYAKNVDNYLIPLNLHIQLMMAIDLKLTFMILIRTCPSADQSILINTDGIIIMTTNNIASLLDLPNNDKNKRINICELCPDMMIIITKIVKKLTKSTTGNHNEKNISGNILNYEKLKSNLIMKYDETTKNKNESNTLNLESRIFLFNKYSSKGSSIQTNYLRFEVNIKLVSEHLDALYFFLNLKYVSSGDLERQGAFKTIINYNKDDCSSECDFKTEKERDFDLSDENTVRDVDDLNPLPSSQLKISSQMKRLSLIGEKQTELKINEQELLISPFSTTRVGLLDGDNKFSFSTRNNPRNIEDLRSLRQSHFIDQNPIYDLLKNEEKKLNPIDSMEMISPKSKNINNNEKFRKPKMEEIFCESSSFVGKKSSRKRFMRKIYTALDISYDPRSLRMRLYTFLLYLIGSLVISIIIQDILIGKIIRIEQDISIIDACNDRLTNYAEIDRRAAMAYAVYTGALSHKRWIEFGYVDFFTSLILLLNDSIVNVLSNNTLIKLSLPNILDEFQLEFYNKRINLYDYYANGTQMETYSTLSVFSAIDQIYSIVQRLLFEVTNDKLYDDFFQDLFFLLRNGFNDLLIALQNSPNILLSDMRKVSSEAITIITFTTIGSSLLGIVIFGISITGLFSTYKENLLILENLLRISKDEITKETAKSKEFITLITTGVLQESKKLVLDKKVKEAHGRSILNLPNRKSSLISKKFSYKLIFWKYSLIMLLLLAGIAFILGNYLRIYTDYKNKHELLSLRMINSNYMFYQQCLGLAGIYNYISENETTYILNRPIKDVMGELIVNISKFSDFLSIFQTSHGEFDSNYEEVFKGNLCVLYQESKSISTAEAAKVCATFAGGVVSQGLVTLNSYLYKVLYNAYINYDISNKTKEAQFEIMVNEMFKNFEFIFYFGNLPGYFHLSNLIIEEIYNSDKTYIDDIRNSAIIGSFCLFLSLIIIWYPMQKKIRNEGNKVKKVMQVYPKAFLLNNHSIKKFMFKSSNGIFGTAHDFYNAL